ncbi:MAG: hypothetical protein WAV46_03680 [Candidatus Moraniibacteriota bacterium]
MSGKKIGRYVLVSILSFFIIFSPVNLSVLRNTSSAQTVPDETISDSVVWSENRVVTGTITVQVGATLTIAKGVTIEFDGQAWMDVNGRLSIEGAPEQPVVLKKKDADDGDFFTIAAVSSGVISARNVDVSGGGSASEIFMVEGNQRDSLFQYANAFWMYQGAFGAQGGGTLDIEGANFHGNPLAVYTDSSSYFQVKVWRSKFSGNTFDFVNTDNSVSNSSDIRYNWWGSADGPEHCTNPDECEPWHTYKKVLGNVNVADWAKEENFKDPVVVIPGIMGSWKMTQKSELKLDPVFGTYDGLLETLDENGYTAGKDLFPFPYEWHYSNVESAKLLKTKINEIKAATKWPRVDIVAHSMGGLVAREYIGTLDGGGNVDQLITLGTPHEGSPNSYLMWEGGKFSSPSRFSIFDFFANGIFQQEAEENGYETVFDYIRKAPIVSVRELLPTYSYLRDKESNALRTYPNLYPINTFLQNLKTTTNMNRLAPVIFTNIVGKTSNDETVGKIRVDGASIELLSDPEKIVLWGHGKPDGYDSVIGDRGLELDSGDGTVPIDSAKGIVSDETIELASSHSNLPSDAAKTVFKTLTGSDALSGVSLKSPTSLLLFNVFSPIDIQIVAPSGKKVGKNFETGGVYDEIPLAYYTGYDTKNEFVTIPNPEEGEYRILTQGTGDGPYRIEAAKITETGASGGEAKESVVSFVGTAVLDMREEKKIELLSDDTVVSEGQDAIPPTTTTVSTAGTAGTNGWYIGDVTLTLAAQDNENGSGVEKTEYSLDNGTTWNVYTDPVVISQEGTTTLQYFSTDKQGNKEEIKTETIKIDKTAPEAKIAFSPTTKKLDIVGTDNLSQNVSVVIVEKAEMNVSNKKVKKIRPWFVEWFWKNRRTLPDMLVTLTDEAGHTTSIAFEKTKDRNGYLFIRVKSIAYDGSEILLSNAVAQYKWQMDWKKQYRLFASYLRTASTDIESHYIPKRNETWIMERPRDLADDTHDDDSERRPIRKRLPGMVISYLQTEKGSVGMSY